MKKFLQHLLQILISSERLLVFSVTSGAGQGASSGSGPEKEEISAKDIRPVLTVHHSELVSILENFLLLY
jgi:hypothetical protein